MLLTLSKVTIRCEEAEEINLRAMIKNEKRENDERIAKWAQNKATQDLIVLRSEPVYGGVPNQLILRNEAIVMYDICIPSQWNTVTIQITESCST